MEWTSDVASGQWIRERTDDEWTIHHFVPRGFEAYARVFHPGFRERPVGRPWPQGEGAWEELEGVEIDTEAVTWSETARAFGTVMHPLASWRGITRADADDWNAPPADGPEGWRYEQPDGGGLLPEMLALLAPHLVAATADPAGGSLGVWDGWGGLVGGEAPSGARGAGGAGHDAMVSSSIKDAFNNPFRRNRWRSGILSDEISRAPRLELPDRAHVLFRADLRELEDPAWTERAPWRDAASATTYPPSLAWPADRAWFVACDVDQNTTTVGGSAELVRALCADPRLEAAELAEGAAFFDDADPVNWGGRSPSA